MLSVKHVICLCALLVVFAALEATLSAEEWYTKKTDWHGFDQYHLTIRNRPAWIVMPKQARKGNPWIWRARFPGYHAEMDIELVRRGFHLAYVDVAGLYGAPEATAIGDAFYQYAVEERSLAAKPALEGVSRGGLFVYNWAVRNPDKVACIYCDTPVLDFTSWPGGKGSGRGSTSDWKGCLAVYGLTEQQGLDYKNNPVDAAARVVASHAIPILHIVSENDVIVPPIENTRLLQKRLGTLNYSMFVISVPEGTEQSSGHHFIHPDPDRVVEFMEEHASIP